jgi:hypothetical protein
MLFCLFVTSSCVNTRYPIERFSCGVNINGSYYNLSGLESRPRETYYDSKSGYTFYLRVCGGFQPGDVPYFQGFGNYAVAACDNRNRCSPLVARHNQDYRPLNDADHRAGVVVEFNSELWGSTQWLHEFRIECDPTQTSALPALVGTASAIRSVHRIRYEFANSRGCPRAIPTPSPTPSFAPRCAFVSRKAAANTSGVAFDLADFNAGPAGIVAAIGRQTVFYQPCERMHCPGRADVCPKGLSSLWLCDDNVTNCIAYGSVSDEMVIDGDVNADDGVVVSLAPTEDGRRANIVLRCDRPNGDHFAITGAAVTEKLLTVSVNASAACPQFLPWEEPIDPFICYTSTTDGHGRFYQFDAAHVNTFVGYRQEIWMYGVPDPTVPRELWYQPCGGIPCPAGADCEQHEDAAVWLCNWHVKSGRFSGRCQAFGFLSNGIRFEPSASADGLKLTYRGPRNLHAEVDLRCNISLQPGQISLLNRGLLEDGTRLSFMAQSRDVCPTASPGPEPSRYYPYFRPPPPDPPAPNPSPNGALFIDHDGEFVFINLSRVQFLNQHHWLTYDRLSCEFWIIAQGIGHTGCPEGADCGGYSQATWWGCWRNPSRNNVCHPIAEMGYGVSLSLIDYAAIESGIILDYAGYNREGAALWIYCEPRDLEPDYIHIDYRMGYNVEVDGARYTFAASSGAACPVPYANSTVPEQTPAPPPARSLGLERFRRKFGDEFSLDISLLHTVSARIAIGADKFFEKVDIQISPVQRIPCPPGAACGGADAANIWKCFNTTGGRACVALGDARFGIQLSAVDEQNLSHGVRVVYSSGLPDCEVEIIMTCDKLLPEDALAISPVGKRLFPANAVTIIAQTSQVCQGHILVWREPVTAGAVILAIIYLAAVLYLFVGTISASCIKRDIAFPHHDFWEEVWIGVRVALLRVFCCMDLAEAMADGISVS